jgi:hypothetical protein
MKRIVDRSEAVDLLTQQGIDFAVIKNPEYIHPLFELVPLAPKVTQKASSLVAAIMDMDGTTTTIQGLVLHSLEYMIRHLSGRLTAAEWRGLDQIIDFPNIIGTDTARPIEFLITRYNNFIKQDFLAETYFYSALWILILGRDKHREEEVKKNIKDLGIGQMLDDEHLPLYIAKKEFAQQNANAVTNYFYMKYKNGFRADNYNLLVRAATDIFFQRYHFILDQIRLGEGPLLAKEIYGDENKCMIEPMPGIAEFLALTKGWLGDEAANFYDSLNDSLKTRLSNLYIQPDKDLTKGRLLKLSKYFSENPLKLGIVTSTIFYEAHIVLSEVFRICQQRIKNWPVSNERKSFLEEKFSYYKNVYDSLVTADDSNGIRLKPHRDLYSIALHQLSISKHDFNRVAGFEDRETGIISIRAAGIGLCIAVPYTKAVGYDLSAAAHILQGGIPEAILLHNIFMQDIA